MHIPSLQTLRAFDAAGRHQSYSKAAEELGLTHGAVSHRIRALEAQTGKRLFERQANRMMLTDEGKRLQAQVRNALGLLENIFALPRARTASQVTISTFPTMAHWLVPRLAAFRKSHPDLDLKLDLTSQLVELGKGVDAAIRYGPGNWPSTESRLLASEMLTPVCSPAYLKDHPLDQPADLLDCTLLRHPWYSWAAWFQAAGVSTRELGQGPEYPDSSLLIEAAIAGEGVALARGLGVADALRQGRLVRPFSISITDVNAYYFVTPERTRDPRLDAFHAWLADELARPGRSPGEFRRRSGPSRRPGRK